MKTRTGWSIRCRRGAEWRTWQYGPDAVVVEPRRVREMVRERLLSVIQ